MDLHAPHLAQGGTDALCCAALICHAVLHTGGSEGRVLGVLSGFVAPPFGILHIDTLQVFTRGCVGAVAWRLCQAASQLDKHPDSWHPSSAQPTSQPASQW